MALWPSVEWQRDAGYPTARKFPLYSNGFEYTAGLAQLDI